MISGLYQNKHGHSVKCLGRRLEINQSSYAHLSYNLPCCPHIPYFGEEGRGIDIIEWPWALLLGTEIKLIKTGAKIEV